MAYELRRSKQKLPEDETLEILHSNNEGMLSLVDADGLPYGIPINYVILGDALYMHGAKSGRNVDAINENSMASFCVVAKDAMLPEKFTTSYVSIIAEGPIEIVDDEQEKHDALFALAKLAGRSDKECADEVNRCISHCLVMRMKLDRICGKESKDLAKARSNGSAKTSDA